MFCSCINWKQHRLKDYFSGFKKWYWLIIIKMDFFFFLPSPIYKMHQIFWAWISFKGIHYSFLTAPIKVCVPRYPGGMSSWSSQHILYGEGLMDTVRCRFPGLLNRVYFIHKLHVVCVWQLHEPRDRTRYSLPNKHINQSFMQCIRGDEITWDLIKRYSEIRDDYITNTADMIKHSQFVFESKHGTVVDSGWDGLHLLPSETGPVIPQNIMSPTGHRLIAVTGHLWTLLRILDTQKKKIKNT